jgi:hypothetical protein
MDWILGRTLPELEEEEAFARQQDPLYRLREHLKEQTVECLIEHWWANQRRNSAAEDLRDVTGELQCWALDALLTRELDRRNYVLSRIPGSSMSDPISKCLEWKLRT